MIRWLRDLLFDSDVFLRNATVALGLFGGGITFAAALPSIHVSGEWLIAATVANALAARLGYVATPPGGGR